MSSGPVVCRGCGTRITFARHLKTGTQMPLDPEPSPAGNVAVRTSGQSKTGRVVHAGQPIDADETRYMSHFATCTRPAEFRKRNQTPPAPKLPAPAEPATLFDAP